MPIETRDGTFLLTTDRTAYALALDAGGIPVRHLTWGPRITLADAVRLATLAPGVRRRSEAISDPHPHDEELPVQGGKRMGELGCAVDLPDGLRGLDLGQATACVDGERLEVTQRDAAAGVRIHLDYEVMAEHDVIRRRTRIVNERSTGDVIVRELASAHWPLPRSLASEPVAEGDVRTAGPLLTIAAGDYAAETRRTTLEAPLGRYVLEGRYGTPGHRQQPFVAVHAGASEERGRVHSVQLAWPGQHRLVVERTLDGSIEVTAGVNPHGLEMVLRPGETWESPWCWGHVSLEGLGGMSRAWHRLERAAISPRGEQERPVVMNSWEATGFDVTEEGQAALARSAADLGVELFMVDDGWFAGRVDQTRGVGDWWADPHRFPHGLRALSDAVHDLGMRFGLWFEAEMVSPHSALHERHPDWVLRYPGREPSLGRDEYVLDLSRPEVAHHVLTQVDRAVTDYGVDMIKWDMNRPISEPYAPPAAPGLRSPSLEHPLALHGIWRELRARHPDLLIETCQSGGGRADLASLALAEWAWTSDNTDALERVAIQDGYSLVHGAHTMSCWVTDCPGVLTGRTTPLAFRFHVAMCGMLGIGGDLLAWSEDERALARRMIARYKGLRRTIQQGSLYRLRRRSQAGEVIVRGYRDEESGRIVLVALAPSIRLTEHTQDIALGALVTGDLDYRVVRTRDADGEDDEDLGTFSAGALRGSGLPLHLRGDCASELYVLTPLSPPARSGR